jgi:hypothetical protein
VDDVVAAGEGESEESIFHGLKLAVLDPKALILGFISLLVSRKVNGKLSC